MTTGLNEGHQYKVLNEHTLGFIHQDMPGYLQILHASPLRGATTDRLAGYTILAFNSRLRDATLKDFEDYQVSPRGHLIPVTPQKDNLGLFCDRCKGRK